MPTENVRQIEYVQEIVDAVIEKVERLPVEDRNLVLIASIEAIASIAAMESMAHSEGSSDDTAAASSRVAHYVNLFAASAEQNLK